MPIFIFLRRKWDGGRSEAKPTVPTGNQALPSSSCRKNGHLALPPPGSPSQRLEIDRYFFSAERGDLSHPPRPGPSSVRTCALTPAAPEVLYFPPPLRRRSSLLYSATSAASRDFRAMFFTDRAASLQGARERAHFSRLNSSSFSQRPTECLLFSGGFFNKKEETFPGHVGATRVA